jgi:hypothetical protein
MRHRLLTATLGTVTLALAALAPASAGASPMPDPSTRSSSAAISTADALYQLRRAYRTAPVEQKLRIHNAIVLVVNTADAAL